MTALVLSGLAILAAAAWLVLRLPAPAGATDTLATRRAQLQASLDELARARAEGMLDAASFADEQRRLQADLAALAPAGPVAAQASARPARSGWPFALAVLVLLPAATVGLYGYLQGPFWQQLDAAQTAPDAAAPPGGAAALVGGRAARPGH